MDAHGHVQRLITNVPARVKKYFKRSTRITITLLCTLWNTVFPRSVSAYRPNRILYPHSGGLEYGCNMVFDCRTEFADLLIDRYVRLDHIGQVGNRACDPFLHGFERRLKVRGKSSRRSLRGDQKSSKDRINAPNLNLLKFENHSIT
jgi:hypothetical protein